MTLPPIPPQALAVAKEAMPVLAPAALNEVKKFWGKNPGSKVKRGAFQGCPLGLFGDKACIILDEDGRIVMLTADTVQCYQYVKKEQQFHGVKRSTYYYYNIYYKDGTSSYVRMHRKYRDAMKKYT